MRDAKLPVRGECDRGRGFKGLGINRGRKLLVIHSRPRRERERHKEEGGSEDDGRFPFIGVAHDLARRFARRLALER